MEEAKTESHFQKALVKIGDYLILVGLALVAVIFLVAMFRHENLLLALQYALVLTVAAVPATLPAVLSVTLAIGAGALALKGAITRKMTAIAVFGWLVTPLSWKLALLVWGFALLELLITDPLKVLVYRILDHRGLIFQRLPVAAP